MKKVICTLLATMVVFSSLSAASKKSLSLDPIVFDLPSEKGNEFTYSIDPRIEVIGTICRLAGYENFSQNYESENLLTQNDLIFSKYKDHKAVKAIQSYRDQKNIGGDAWIDFAYYIKPDFSGTIVDFKSYPNDINHELKKLTAKQLEALVSLIHDFVVDTNYTRIIALNRGTYISDFGWMREDIEKIMIHTWGKDFFNFPEVSEVNIVVSRYVCGGDYYDFVTGADGIRKYYLTVYPGTYYSSLVMDYSMIYGQLYANDNWDTIKDNFTKYLKDIAKKANPDKEKEIDKEEIYGNTAASVLSLYCYLDYCKYRADHQTDEDIQNYGDYSQTYDSVYQYLEKSYGNNATNAIKLLEKYRSDRKQYPDFKSLYPELNDYLNSIKAE